MENVAATSIPPHTSRHGGPVADRMRDALAFIYSEENDKLLSAAMLGMPKGWIALRGVVMEDAGLDGDEYFLLHPAFGIIILDILPTVPTPPKAAHKIREALARDAAVAGFGAVSDVGMLGIHHSEVATISRVIDSLFSVNAPNTFSRDKEWAEAVRRVLKATRVERRQADPAVLKPCARGTRRFRNMQLTAIVIAGGALAALALWYRSQPSPFSPFQEAQITLLDSLNGRSDAASPPLAGRGGSGSVLLTANSPLVDASVAKPPLTLPLGAAGLPDGESLPLPQLEVSALPTSTPPPEAQGHASAWMAVLSAPEDKSVPEGAEERPAHATRTNTPVQSSDAVQSAVQSSEAAHLGGGSQGAWTPAVGADAPRGGAGPLPSGTAATPVDPTLPQAGAPQRTVTPRKPPPFVLMLIQKGNEMVSLGDFFAARLFYNRAAAEQSGEASLALGKTYDPFFLANLEVRGLQGNTGLAAEWYRRALLLGVEEAEDRLLQLGVSTAEQRQIDVAQ